MRRLRDFQSVDVRIGEVTLSARVTEVREDSARLVPQAGWPEGAGRLPLGATIVFTDAEAKLVELRGVLDAGAGGSLSFTPPDDPAGDVRRSPRLRFDLPVTITPIGEDDRPTGPPISGRTVDVSSGGLLVACGDLVGRVHVAVQLPGAAADLVRATGTVLRAGARDSAIRFEVVDVGGHGVLEAFVSSVRDTLARRFLMRA